MKSESLVEVTDAVAEMHDHAKAVQRRSKSSVRRHLAEEIRLANALISILTFMVVGLHSKDRKDRLYPTDWLSPTGVPDPDEVLSLGFCQLANYAFAIVDLIEKGLDTPARALVRSVAELSQMLIVIAHDREVFQAYITEAPEGDKKKWYELFSSKKIAKRLAFFERKLGAPEFAITETREWQKESAEFFSQAIHHSFHSVVIGALPSIPGTENASLCLLGGPNGASGATMTHLIISIQMCLGGFFRMIEDVHKFERAIPASNSFWTGKQLFDTLEPEFRKWLRSKIG